MKRLDVAIASRKCTSQGLVMTGEPANHTALHARATDPSTFLLHLSDRLRSLADPVEVALCAAEILGQHLQVPRAGYGEIDAAGEIVLVRQDWTDGTVGSLARPVRGPS